MDKDSAREKLLAEPEKAQADVESQPLLIPAKFLIPEKYELPAKAAAPPSSSALDGPPVFDTDSGFSTGLCDCCEGPKACQICCMSAFLPCFAHGIIADDASNGESSQKLPCMLYTFGWIGLSWLIKSPAASIVTLGTLTRSKLRTKYGMHSDGCADCCTHFWCHPCAMAQEIRHIRDARVAMASAPGPGGIANVDPESAEKMQLVSWTPVRHRDQVACLTSAYL